MSRERLPFEPGQKKKKIAKKAPTVSSNKTSSNKTEQKTATKVEKSKNTTSNRKKTNMSAIPDVVSKRMIRRMALFSGIPSAMGFLSFFMFYWIVSHKWLKVATPVVLGVSLGFLGLGVVGLSYGLLSASWDEKRVGGWWGWPEFRLNFGRMSAAWRGAKTQTREE